MKNTKKYIVITDNHYKWICKLVDNGKRYRYYYHYFVSNKKGEGEGEWEKYSDHYRKTSHNICYLPGYNIKKYKSFSEILIKYPELILK